MAVTVITEEPPEEPPVVIVEDANVDPAEIVDGAAALAETIVDAANDAAVRADAQAIDIDALRRDIRAEVQAEMLAHQAEVDAAVAAALAAKEVEETEIVEDTTDTITPTRSHPWFRSPAEWFGGS